MNKCIILPEAKIITKETVGGEFSRYTSGEVNYALNSNLILRAWTEISPNNYEQNDDHSVLLVEDIRGNIYVADESDDCLLNESHAAAFLSSIFLTAS